jgi:hypothetical protein
LEASAFRRFTAAFWLFVAVFLGAAWLAFFLPGNGYTDLKTTPEQMFG